MVGEGHVAHIDHVLQQGEGIHRQIPEGVLHQPGALPLLQGRHQGQGNRSGQLRITRKHKQQPLPLGSGMATAA